MRVVTAVLVALAAFSVPIAAEEAQEVSVTGEPVDISCYLGGRSGEGHAACAKSCVEGGKPVGFVTIDDEGKEHLYLVMGGGAKAAKDYLAEYMGQEVTATGTLVTKDGMKVLTVSKVEVAEDDEDWFPSEGVGSGSIQNQ